MSSSPSAIMIFLEKIKTLNPKRYEKYDFLLNKSKIDSFIFGLDLLANPLLQEHILQLETNIFENLQEKIEQKFDIENLLDIEYPQQSKIIYDYLKEFQNMQVLIENLQNLERQEGIDLLDTLRIVEVYKDFPEFLYDICLIGTKIRNVANSDYTLRYAEVDTLFSFLKINKITAFYSSEFYLFLYDCLRLLSTQYDDFTYIGLLVDLISNGKNPYAYSLDDDAFSIFYRIEHKMWKSKELLVEVLQKNDFARFIDILRFDKLYLLDKYEKYFANKMFLEFINNTNIENVLIILNCIYPYNYIKKDLKLAIALNLNHINNLDYYFIMFAEDFKNTKFKNQFLKIIRKNKNIQNLKEFENKLNLYCQTVNS